MSLLDLASGGARGDRCKSLSFLGGWKRYTRASCLPRGVTWMLMPAGDSSHNSPHVCFTQDDSGTAVRSVKLITERRGFFPTYWILIG